MTISTSTVRARRILRLLALSVIAAAVSFALLSGPRKAASQGLAPLPAVLLQSKAWQRYQWFYEQRAYPGGYIPSDARLRGQRQIASYRDARPELRSAAAWSEVGPAPLENRRGDIFTQNLAVSGRTPAIAVNPKKRKQVIVGGAQGGLWVSRNAGKSWNSAGDDLLTLAFGALAWSSDNTRVIYAGTGEQAFSGDAYAGVGVYKSRNGGKSWNLVNKTSLLSINTSAIVVDPQDVDTVIMSTAGFGRRQTAGRDRVGIYRSTDGGVTWSLTLEGHATHLVADAKDFNTMYAALGNLFSAAENGLYRSADAGQTWTKLAGPWDGDAGRMELALSSSHPETLYVGVQSVDTFGLQGLYKTTNASGREGARVPAFEKLTLPRLGGRDSYCATQCWYDHILLTDPKDPETLYAGGVYLWKLKNGKWESLLPGHVDQHALAWSGKTLYSGNDGGVFSSRNGGKTWKSLNDGLQLTQFYHGAIHPKDNSFLIGGTQDNGTPARDAGLGSRRLNDAWTRIMGGDGADVEVSRDNPDTDWAMSTQNNQIRRTRDGGRTIERVTGNINTGDGPFIGVFAMCPSDSDVFVLGTNRAWRSDNFFSGAGVLWKDQKGPKLAGGETIRAIAFSPADAQCNTYAVGTNRGSIFVTKNGGRKWTDADKARGVPGRFVTDLAFDPDSRGTLWVTLSGFDEFTVGAPGHVFMTTNATASRPRWAAVGPPVNLPMNAIVIQPGNPNKAWVGSDLGIWEQTAAARGIEWAFHGPDEGVPNVAVFDLQADEDMVAAFTHGRGAFVLAQEASDARPTEARR